jgi:divalent metal cation (Fe/Co/Zn/Cd) transporter
MIPPQPDREKLLRRGILLEYFTVGYNVLEGIVAIGIGVAAGSVALVGFGVDSLIEIVAAVALLWRLISEKRGTRGEDAHFELERRALYVVGLTFFALAIYIVAEAGYNLFRGEGAQQSVAGIVLAALSVLIMPLLAVGKQRVAASLGSRALASDAKETWICSYLSVVLLFGVTLNWLYGWSWVDSVAALAMLPLIVKEGLEAWEEAREEQDED